MSTIWCMELLVDEMWTKILTQMPIILLLIWRHQHSLFSQVNLLSQRNLNPNRINWKKNNRLIRICCRIKFPLYGVETLLFKTIHMVNKNCNFRYGWPPLGKQELKRGVRWTTNILFGFAAILLSMSITAFSIWIFVLYGLSFQYVPNMLVGVGLSFSLVYILVALFYKRLRKLLVVQLTLILVLLNLFYYIYIILCLNWFFKN